MFGIWCLEHNRADRPEGFGQAGCAWCRCLATENTGARPVGQPRAESACALLRAGFSAGPAVFSGDVGDPRGILIILRPRWRRGQPCYCAHEDGADPQGGRASQGGLGQRRSIRKRTPLARPTVSNAVSVALPGMAPAAAAGRRKKSPAVKRGTVTAFVVGVHWYQLEGRWKAQI